MAEAALPAAKTSYPPWHYLVAAIIAAFFSLNILYGQYLFGGAFLAIAIVCTVLYVQKLRARRSSVSAAVRQP